MKQKILIKLWKLSQKIYKHLTFKIINMGAKDVLNYIYGTSMYADTDSVKDGETDETEMET